MEKANRMEIALPNGWRSIMVKVNRMEIALPNGYKLVAKQNADPNYSREIFVVIEAPDGTWLQDLAIIRRGEVIWVNYDCVVKNSLRIHVSTYDRMYSGETTYTDGVKVVLEEGGIKKAYFYDSIGWREAPGIWPLQTVDIHACPNHCGALLTTTAHIVQTWKVDELGNVIEKISTDGVIHRPDSGNTWECIECGAEAEEIKCRQVKISTGRADGNVFVPTVPRGCVFWQATGEMAIKYVPVQPDERGIPTVAINEQVFYLADLEKGE